MYIINESIDNIFGRGGEVVGPGDMKGYGMNMNKV